jgi:F-box and leucine-rich repeat protein GRR1
MIRIIDRLPTKEEYRRIRHLVLQQSKKDEITDDDLAQVLPGCPHLESVVLSGVPDTTDRTIVLLASTAVNLQGIDLTGCEQVTDVGVLDLTAKSLPLQWVQLNGVVGLTDPSISSIAKSCPALVELELCDLPLLTALSMRDIWSFSRKLRTLRLARCPLITDSAFPSSVNSKKRIYSGTEKPLPPIPENFMALPPLVLHHTAENLRVLDIAYCSKVTDDAVEGIIKHAPKIQTIVLSGCTLLTDRAVESVCRLGDHLDILMLAHVTNITDRSIMQLARSCTNLRSIDVSCTFCAYLRYDRRFNSVCSLSSPHRYVGI